MNDIFECEVFLVNFDQKENLGFFLNFIFVMNDRSVVHCLQLNKKILIHIYTVDVDRLDVIHSPRIFSI